jgi:hypothetical protein
MRLKHRSAAGEFNAAHDLRVQKTPERSGPRSTIRREDGKVQSQEKSVTIDNNNTRDA